MAKIIIVDEDDKEVGVLERDQINDEIYRVAALWLTNSKGQVLLAQRSFKKKNSPGRWGPAAAGTVEADESYESNIIKEAEEELGLTGVNLEPFKKIRVNYEYGKNYFCQYFKAEIDMRADDFRIDKEEVEQVAWFDKEFLLNDLKKHPIKYVVSIARILKV